MCTAFPYCWISVQRLLGVIHAIIFTGGFMAGPRALRPERLRWLTTSAVNRQVRPPDALRHQSHVEPEAQSLRHARHKHADGGHRAIWSSGRSAMRTQDAAFPSRAPRPFFLKILIGVKPGRNLTLPLPTPESGAGLR